MEINYIIKEVKPKVYAVIVPDDYHRAMLFMRVQEYYESPNSNFRGKSFDIWDYIEWYSRGHKDAFTYAFDWGGFNIPLEIAYRCYDTLKDAYTPYDELMESIIFKIYEMNGDDANGYIIGAGDLEGETFIHEVCHGLYHTNASYKKLADEITEIIPTSMYKNMMENLMNSGYTIEVIDDEIQAYMMSNWEYTNFSKGIPKKECNRFAKLYKQTLESFLK
jgi:hypothetical protein